MAQVPEDYVAMGAFGAPYGIKGWLKLVSFADPAENILEYRRFLMETPAGLTPVEVDESRAHGKGFVAHIKGCDDRDDTRRYTGHRLLLPKQDLPPLDDGEYYWYQLIGLRVENRSGQLLGQVDRLLETGANDVLVVRPAGPAGDEEKQNDILIPFVVGPVVLDIALDDGLIRVDWEADY